MPGCWLGGRPEAVLKAAYTVVFATFLVSAFTENIRNSWPAISMLAGSAHGEIRFA